MKRKKLKKRPDGRYRLYYHGHQIYGYTQDEVYANRDAFIQREREQALLAQNLTVQAYSVRWVTTYKAHLTRQPYNACVRVLKRFCEHKNIGQKHITDVSTTDVQSFFNTYIGMGKSSIIKMSTAIKGMFQSAVADRIITYDPTLKAKQPKGDSGSHRAITQHERDLIQAVQHPLRPCVMLMLYAGLRRGEALSIDVDRDVDFENKVIHVTQSIRFDHQVVPVRVSTKTKAGVRTIPLLSVLENQLKDVHGIVAKPVRREKDGKNDETINYMSKASFTSAWRSYLYALEAEQNGITKRWYGKTNEQKKMLENGTLPPWKQINIRPHDLRHSYATMLCSSGVDLKTAMLFMGHADQSMLLKIYDHPDEYRIKKAAENMEKLLQTVQKTVQE